MLTPGEPAPWFTARSTVNPAFKFDTMGGSYVVLCFCGSAASPESRRLLEEVDRQRAHFDLENCCFFGVSVDPDDERLGRVGQRWPGIVYFWDFDLSVSLLYGVVSPDGSRYQRQTFVLDPALRTLAVLPFEGDPDAHVKKLVAFLGGLPPIKTLDGFAPVLSIPNVFEPEFCRTLIGRYEQHGGQEIGSAHDIEGKTVNVVNPSFKRRADYTLTEQHLIQAAAERLQRRVFPEIKKVFQFNARHVERYIVGCYDASTGGHFKKHRDHLTKATAHRRFAVTINLNTEDYEGGELRFPEFGSRAYRAPTGGALVFSCALLHEVLRVTKGKRYAFLPFLYDDEAAKILEMNAPQRAESADSVTVCWLQRRFDEVRWKVEKALRQPSLPVDERAQLRVSLVNLAIETGEIAKAENEMQQVPAEADNLPEVLAVGALLFAVQDKNLGFAEYRLRSALQQQPANSLYYSWLGLVLAKRGYVHEGLQIMEEVRRHALMAANPSFLDFLGDVYLLANDPGKAQEAWHHALQVFPSAADPADFRKLRVQEKLNLLRSNLSSVAPPATPAS